ncbi:hypothetical protein Scep_014371 [Stephania cephalantha]|uniref:Uncharacterized protein n=1 Tax=Stephania cephalantha TaxID=152367 RepID=A0AAP0J1V9_9MAGN
MAKRGGEVEIVDEHCSGGYRDRCCWQNHALDILVVENLRLPIIMLNRFISSELLFIK